VVQDFFHPQDHVQLEVAKNVGISKLRNFKKCKLWGATGHPTLEIAMFHFFTFSCQNLPLNPMFSIRPRQPTSFGKEVNFTCRKSKIHIWRRKNIGKTIYLSIGHLPNLDVRAIAGPTQDPWFIIHNITHTIPCRSVCIPYMYIYICMYIWLVFFTHLLSGARTCRVSLFF
jgi:hypothetical protein